jgi:cell division protein FtsB
MNTLMSLYLIVATACASKTNFDDVDYAHLKQLNWQRTLENGDSSDMSLFREGKGLIASAPYWSYGNDNRGQETDYQVDDDKDEDDGYEVTFSDGAENTVEEEKADYNAKSAYGAVHTRKKKKKKKLTKKMLKKIIKALTVKLVVKKAETKVAKLEIKKLKKEGKKLKKEAKLLKKEVKKLKLHLPPFVAQNAVTPATTSFDILGLPSTPLAMAQAVFPALFAIAFAIVSLVG